MTTVVFGVGLIVELCDVVTCRTDSAVLQGPRRPDTVALAETAHDARTAFMVDCDAAHDGTQVTTLTWRLRHSYNGFVGQDETKSNGSAR